MQINLRPGLYAAVWGRDLVFFDAINGSYQMAAGLAHAAGASVVGGRLSVHEPGVINIFSEQQMLSLDRTPRSDRHAPPPRPTSSALAETYGGSTAALAIARAYTEMAWLYLGRPLPFFLAHARAQSSRRGGQLHSDGLFTLARAFEHFSPCLPWQGACVFRGFMLMRLLTRGGAGDVRWVFGVRTWPFHAHCWVQHGDVVLSDYAESLLRYTPIFAV
jgi:hypothetical protein